MKSVATVMQVTRSLLILTPAEYDKPEGGLSGKKKGGMPTNFSVPFVRQEKRRNADKFQRTPDL